MEERKKRINEIIPYLNSLKETNKSKEAKATVFEGFNGFKAAVSHRNEILKRGDEILIISTSDGFLLRKFRIFINKTEIIREKKGIKIRVITPIKFKGKVKKTFGKYELREDRFIGLNSPSVLVVYSNYVQINVFEGKELYPICFLINSKELADSYRKYFEILWEQAKP